MPAAGATASTFSSIEPRYFFAFAGATIGDEVWPIGLPLNISWTTPINTRTQSPPTSERTNLLWVRFIAAICASLTVSDSLMPPDLSPRNLRRKERTTLARSISGRGGGAGGCAGIFGEGGGGRAGGG